MKNKFLLGWLFFHGAVIFSFLASLLISPSLSFKTSLFDIMPPSSSLREVQAADTKLAEKTGRAVTILAKAASFDRAKAGADAFYGHFQPESSCFDSLSLYVDSSSVSEVSRWLHENRFFLIDGDDRVLLESGKAGEIASDALSSIYGAFSISDLSYLEQDPFLLSERSMKHYFLNGAVSATAMALRDDVLFSELDGQFFVLIRGLVSEEGSSLTGKKSSVKSMYEVAELVKKEMPGLDFIFSGVPFHSYENASSAQRQISVISTISVILILVLFLLIFGSFLPALVSVLAVTFSCGMGLVSVLLIYRSIHVLTFVFGTTLIGTCLDYSIHFFTSWKSQAASLSGEAIKKRIVRGVTLGFLSTEICFAALFFAPFPLLKQVSIFLACGLLSAYLSVFALYPGIVSRKNLISFLDFNLNFSLIHKILSRKSRQEKITPLIRWLPLFLFCFSVLVIAANFKSFRVKNNIQELYSMSPKMLENEILSAKVLDTGSSGWYFIVKAGSEEDLLQKNEELDAFLDGAVAAGKMKSYLSVTSFLPSEKRQKESYEAAGRLLPFLSDQYEALGYSENIADYVRAYEKDYSESKKLFFHVNDSQLPEAIRDGISSIWIGEIDGSFYSCVLPLHVKAEEEAFFREYAESSGGVFFVNKVKDISAQLDELSQNMLKLLGLSFLLVIVILLFCYSPRLVLKITAIPVIICLVTGAVLILCRISLGFFPITGFVLVFGLGLDYIIYGIEGKKSGEKEKERLNDFAILLSFVTTALSFGALAFSDFPPVHTLGLTVFVGLTSAVISSFCIAKS
ncbi:MAG: MMPL family transporter [Treponema sp.]|nr:MMPL family transporter [Treponema sp.]